VLNVQGDVSNMDDLTRLFDEVGRRFGRVDTLLVNAPSS
jgi:NAD(P)-dependent dehydrogenase (short-subunit alcohol dehydrogenase family)